MADKQKGMDVNGGQTKDEYISEQEEPEEGGRNKKDWILLLDRWRLLSTTSHAMTWTEMEGGDIEPNTNGTIFLI